ncbi:DUF2244 domain-containing protein [Frigidibacter sp. MR17.14]|uniref:DUF2244 domain-containing protein n=1 Tax=Frigidibacter sp. MR17.14 TaxID=3126509 RepID=UPI003013083F
MPYEWIAAAPVPAAAADAVTAELHLWPYRSLPRRGFVAFIAATCLLLLLPLIAVLGSPVLWALLPFLVAAVGAVWWALSRSYRDGEVLEVLRLAPGTVTLSHRPARGASREWQANPYWVELQSYDSGGPVPHYLTLRGAGREVEIGAFLSEDERRALKPELQRALSRLRAPAAP